MDKVKINQNKTIIINGYATEDLSHGMLANWADDLTYISYYTYGFNLNGDLIPINDSNLINAAYDSGVAPLMVITPVNESGVYR